MKQVLLRVSLKSKKNQGLSRDSLNMFLLIYKRLKRIECLTLGLKGEKVVVHKVRALIVTIIVKGCWVNVQWDWEIDVIVERVSTHCNDSRKGD